MIDYINRLMFTPPSKVTPSKDIFCETKIFSFVDLFPTPFDGFRLAINKGLSNHFQVSHSLNLTNAPQGSSYHFGATYVGGAQTSPSEVTIVLYKTHKFVLI